MRPGDKVICIDATIEAEKQAEIAADFEIWIKKDQEYTLREILDNDGIATGVLLEEIYNHPKYMRLINRTQEPAFAIWRFRKQAYATNQAEVTEKEEILQTN